MKVLIELRKKMEKNVKQNKRCSFQKSIKRAVAAFDDLMKHFFVNVCYANLRFAYETAAHKNMAERTKEYCRPLEKEKRTFGRKFAIWLLSLGSLAIGIVCVILAGKNKFDALLMYAGIVFTACGIITVSYSFLAFFQDSSNLLLKVLEIPFWGILSIVCFIAEAVKKITRVTNQDKIIHYYPWIGVGVPISMSITLLLFCGLKNLINCVGCINELMPLAIFVIAFATIFSYFSFCKIMVTLDIRSTVRIELINEQKTNGMTKQATKKWLHQKEGKNKIKELKDKKWNEIENQYEITKLAWYIVLSIVMLCLPPAREGVITDKYFADLAGIISITAIGREIKGRMTPIDSCGEA